MTDKQAKPASLTGIGVKRPLIPVVLALMAGLAAASWGFEVSGKWLVIGLAGLLAVMLLLHRFGSVQGSKDQEPNDPDDPTGPGPKSNSRW